MKKPYEIEVSRLKAKIKKAMSHLKSVCVAYEFETLDLIDSVWIHKVKNNELVYSKNILMNANKHQDCLQVYILNQQLEKIDEIESFIKSNVDQLVA